MNDQSLGDQKRTCPHCKHHGTVVPDFGLKTIRGVKSSQSWCNKCRAETNYYARPRSYRLKSRVA